MGLLGKLFGGGDAGKPVSFNRQEAFCGFLLAVIAADGVITDEEIMDFYAAVNRAQVMASVDQRQFKKSMDKLTKVMKKDGLNQLLELSALGITPDMHKGTFVYAVDMVYSDSNVDPDEIRVMDRIKDLLRIEDDFANKAARVAKAKAAV